MTDIDFENYELIKGLSSTCPSSFNGKYLSKMYEILEGDNEVSKKNILKLNVEVLKISLLTYIDKSREKAIEFIINESSFILDKDICILIRFYQQNCDIGLKLLKVIFEKHGVDKLRYNIIFCNNIELYRMFVESYRNFEKDFYYALFYKRNLMVDYLMDKINLSEENKLEILENINAYKAHFSIPSLLGVEFLVKHFDNILTLDEKVARVYLTYLRNEKYIITSEQLISLIEVCCSQDYFKILNDIEERKELIIYCLKNSRDDILTTLCNDLGFRKTFINTFIEHLNV